MKKGTINLIATVIAFALGATIASAVVAGAHTWYGYILTDARWSADDPEFGFATSYIGDPVITSAGKSDIQAGAAKWNAVSGSTFDIFYDGDTWWDGDVSFCNSFWTEWNYGMEVLVGTDSMSGSTYAIAGNCRAVGGNAYRGQLIFNENKLWGTDQQSTQYPDVLGVSVHEFGHVAGWTVHFSGGTDCPTYYFDSPYYQTMCGSASTLETHFMRTLEDHDEHVQAGGY